MRAFQFMATLGLSICLPCSIAASGREAASIEAGEAIYGRCAACHSLAQDRTGPRHCGLFGRRAGSIEGFAYSKAMKRSKIIWNEKTLDRFLANPDKTVPGTTMTITGIADKKERADLIAFLRRASKSPEC